MNQRGKRFKGTAAELEAKIRNVGLAAFLDSLEDSGLELVASGERKAGCHLACRGVHPRQRANSDL